MKNVLKRLNVELPFDAMKVGESFFIRKGDRYRDGNNIRKMAVKSGIYVTVVDSEEADGSGIRVQRVG